MQGFSGILSTPDALVTAHGSVDLQANNYLNTRFEHQTSAENYLFSLGFLPNMEIGGRHSITFERKGDALVRKVNDLSGNIKIAVPTFLNHVKFALGAQDFAGSAKHFQTHYVVSSLVFRQSSFNLGYGRSQNQEQLKAWFGGVTWNAAPWLKLLAEHDGIHKQFGIQLAQRFGPAELSAKSLLLSEREDIDPYLAFSINLPLGKNYSKTPAKDSESMIQASTSYRNTPKIDETPELTQGTHSNVPLSNTATYAKLKSLYTSLTKTGFRQVRMGQTQQTTLHIETENSLFKHSVLDALGVILGLTVTELRNTGYRNVEILLREYGVPILSIRAPVSEYWKFLQSKADNAAVQAPVEFDMKAAETSRISWFSFPPQSRPAAEWIIYPKISTFVGTEYGIFDYSTALHNELRIPLWEGALLNFGSDIAIGHSESFDDRKIFASSRIDTGVTDAYVHQLYKSHPSQSNLLSIGSMKFGRIRYEGIWHESLYIPGDGGHSARLKLGYFRHEEEVKKPWIVSYRYQFSPLDLQFILSHGRYWYNDIGNEFTIRRFFGDTAVSFYVKKSSENIGGIRVSIPLTPRKEFKPGFIQIRGSQRWAYGLETTFAREDNTNTIDTSLVVEPYTSYNLLKDVYDSDRLSPAYLYQHTYRLRNAYYSWDRKQLISEDQVEAYLNDDD